MKRENAQLIRSMNVGFGEAPQQAHGRFLQKMDVYAYKRTARICRVQEQSEIQAVSVSLVEVCIEVSLDKSQPG